MLSSPQHLIDGEIAELKRFGYTPFGDAAPDWVAMWEHLKGDFATLRRPRVPDFAELSPWPQEGARIYMRRRLLADRLFEECQVLYRSLHMEGINIERVEAYTLGREAYEEAVLDFGKAREMLEDVFSRTVDLAPMR
ncbi:MAG: hypothetical protein A3H93_16980 [Rhodocyclales bacterium RIFCSPLOWO2_02_FULL_63_24]|nr:MAG: hypothetical protein A3H93_16980 [Rhodocyclales bacterium RIFCSPLOWO2_02_FULL_63_24]